MAMKIVLNQKEYRVEAASDTPLLWVIRDHLKFTGTKYGCGMAQCGACTVHLDGQPIRSCVTPIAMVEGKSITTIEGNDSRVAQAVHDAWDQLQVTQCGYCQSGQIMSATALLTKNAKPTDQDIDTAMSGNICRCNTYVRIRAAIKQAAANLEAQS